MLIKIVGYTLAVTVGAVLALWDLITKTPEQREKAYQDYIKTFGPTSY